MNRGLKIALTVGGIAAAMVLLMYVVPGLIWGWRGYGYGMMGSGFMGGYGTMFFMPVLWIVVVGLILWAVVAAVRKPGESDRSAGSSDSPMEILKRRFARGEIGKDEYEARKKDLL